MTRTVQDVMTPQPVTVDADTTVRQAAEVMREADIGDVVVVSDGEIRGIVTDRDLVVRALADGCDPTTTPVAQVLTTDPVTLAPGDDVEDAMKTMSTNAIRRLPVVSGGRLVGIVSLGDLAAAGDPAPALREISEAPPNN